MKTLISKLVWPAYLAGVIFTAYSGVSLYLDASSIMKDHTVIEAPIELVDTTSRTKRGHTSITYNFNYSYTVDGKEYSSPYSAVNKHGERYLEEQVITLAYSNADPAKAGALHVLERQSSLWGMIKGFLIFSLILGVVALFVYGWSVAGKEDEDPGEGVAASATPKVEA